MSKLFVFWVCVLASSVLSAEVVTGTDELAKLPYWELREKAMTFRLVQRLPDQTRAYFSGRGFGDKDVEYIAGYCFFQTVFTNTSTTENFHTIRYNADEWRVIVESREKPFLTRKYWRAIWQQRQAKKSQRIAFEWSIFPTRQQYQPADYNWGMTVFKIPRGVVFDLKLLWLLDGEKQNATIKNIQCAEDVYVPPVAQE